MPNCTCSPIELHTAVARAVDHGSGRRWCLEQMAEPGRWLVVADEAGISGPVAWVEAIKVRGDHDAMVMSMICTAASSVLPPMFS